MTSQAQATNSNPKFKIYEPRLSVIDIVGPFVFGKNLRDGNCLEVTVGVPAGLSGNSTEEVFIEVEGVAHPDAGGKNRLRGECWSVHGKLRHTDKFVLLRVNVFSAEGYVQQIPESRCVEFAVSQQLGRAARDVTSGPGLKQLIEALFHGQDSFSEPSWSTRNVLCFKVQYPGTDVETHVDFDVLGIYNLLGTRPWRKLLLILRDKDGGTHECEYDLKNRTGMLFKQRDDFKIA